MQISIDYEVLTYASDYIAKLKNTAFTINDSLQESMGCANDMEKSIIALLSEICTVTFPEMLESSRRLLQAIATDFKNLDETLGTPSSAGSIAEAVSGVAQSAIDAVQSLPSE